MQITSSPLTKRDLDSLASSWITSELANQAQLQRVLSQEGARIVGLKNRANYAGIVFPYIWPGQTQAREYRLRRDKPDLRLQTDGTTKEERKYLAPIGRGNMIYITPGTSQHLLNDLGLPIIITEGEKKTLSLHRLSLYQTEGTKPRFLPIGLPGVWNWTGVVGKTTDAEGARCDIKGVIGDIDRIAWDKREVYLLFDSNVNSNTSVRDARQALGKELKKRRAIVYFVTLPEIPGLNGVDDHLAKNGPEFILDLIQQSQIADIKIPEGFRVSESGVYAIDPTGERDDTWICSWLVIAASTRNYQGEEWGQLLMFKDKDSHEHKWLMPMSLLAGEGSEYRENLLRLGLRISPGRKARELLTNYIQTANPEQRVRVVNKVGWHQNVYVLPDESYSANKAEHTIFQSSTGSKHYLGIAGSLDDWRNNVSKYCVGNSALIFAVSVAFSGPVMDLASEGGGGFHFRGKSSTGKTTALLAAGSVWGGGSRHGYVQPWRTTANGLEAIAELFNHGLLCLDELGQCDPKEAGEIAYTLANGQGKLRMSRSIAHRRKLDWQLVYLSSGETSLMDHVMLSGRQTRGGQEVRLCDIDCQDMGSGMGLFEDIHGFKHPSEFALFLSAACKNNYGSAIRAFLSRLVRMLNEAEDIVKKTRGLFIKKYVPPNASGEVFRVAGRFALVAAAGELAHEITGWPKGAAVDAAAKIFKNWLLTRGSSGYRDTDSAISQVRAFLETHGSSRFRDLDSRDEERIYNRAGFKRSNDAGQIEFLILPEVFRNEVCKGFDYRAVAKAMVDKNLMTCEQGNGRALTVREMVPELGRVRVFVVLSSIFELE